MLKWADVLSMKTYTKYIRKQYRCAIVKLTFWDYLVLALHCQDVPKLCDNLSTLKYLKKPISKYQESSRRILKLKSVEDVLYIGSLSSRVSKPTKFSVYKSYLVLFEASCPSALEHPGMTKLAALWNPQQVPWSGY